MKRFLCGWLCICLLITGLCFAMAEEEDDEALGEDNTEVSQQEEEDVKQLDTEDDSIYEVTGKVFPEPTRKDFNASSPAIYTCTLRENYSIFSEMSVDSRRVVGASSYKTRNLDVLYVGLQWMIIRKGKEIGYVKREWVEKESVKPLDPVNTAPFNVQKHAYTAVTAAPCHVRKSMDLNKGDGDDGNNWVILKEGTKITIWQFYEGWAMVNYMRSYGYIDPNELTDLRPVSPTDEELFPDCPIAAYTSYYKMVQSETNINRIHNIKLGCGFISRVVEPGEIFDANKIMGRYNASKGYKQAPVMLDGKTVPGYGGGTCQVASTLYNVLIQMPKLTILYRHPHGGNGASYLPIHCDAAVGNAKLNLRFQNNYDFPIRIEALSNDDGALSIRIYKAD